MRERELEKSEREKGKKELDARLATMEERSRQELSQISGKVDSLASNVKSSMEGMFGQFLAQFSPYAMPPPMLSVGYSPAIDARKGQPLLNCAGAQVLSLLRLPLLSELHLHFNHFCLYHRLI